MAMRASALYAHVRHRLGDEPTEFSSQSLVNDAGKWLIDSHGWKFLSRPPRRLSLRGTITITAATWDEATLTLTVMDPASAFAAYTLLEGDQVEIAGGTGADLGFYDVVSTDGAADITLRTSIGAAADAQTDIVGSLELAGLLLPSDISELAGTPSGSVANHSIIPTTMQGLIDARDAGVYPQGGDFYGAITYGVSVGPDGGAPVPRLELYPPPASDDLNSVTIYYRAGWTKITRDDQYSSTPDWFDPLLIQAVRAYSYGIETDTMGQALAEVLLSPMYAATQRRDGVIQRNLGPIRGSRIKRSLGPIGNESVSLTFNYP